MIAFSAVLLFLFGLILAVGGAYLVWLGGSGYYLIAGLAFALSAVYLLQKRSRGLSLFAITLVATYAWALWESGYDWWPLATRVGLPSLFGLWFVLPFFRRAWQRQSPDGTRGLPALTALVAVAAVAAFGSIANPTHEYPAFCGGYDTYPDYKAITWTWDEVGPGIFYHDRKLNERFLTVVS